MFSKKMSGPPFCSNSALILSLLLVLSGCQSTGGVSRIEPFPEGIPSPIPLRTLSLKSTHQVKGQKWMAASDAPWAAATAHQIFHEGGNIIDAAVAASLVGGVEHPQSTGIGGGGFFVYHSVRDQKTYVWDFRERAPLKIRKELYQGKKDASLRGGLAVATPGLIAGLFEIHQKHGKLPWKQVVEPARKLAYEGVWVDSLLAKGLADTFKNQKLADILDVEFKEIFFPGGQPLQEGDLLKQRALAGTFEKIAKGGAQAFYQGSIAQAMVQSVKKRGGVLSLEDLARYKVRAVEPIEIQFAGQTLRTMPLPSSGGLLLGEMLGMLGQVKGFSGWKPQSARYSHTLIEVMRRAYRDRALYFGDRPGLDISAFLNADYWKAQVASIEEDHASTPDQLQVYPLAPSKRESKQTTHYSVMDAEGNAVSTTQTINYIFGSQVMAKGTGILLNDEMDDFSIGAAPNVYGLPASEANQVAPGKTPLSSMTPTLVFRDGKVIGSLGAPGGSQIPSTVLQEYLRFFVHDLSAEQAFDLPRFHQQYSPVETRVEPLGEHTASLKRKLYDMGHSFVTDMSWTRISLIKRLDDGHLLGIADPRASGQAAGQ